MECTLLLCDYLTLSILNPYQVSASALQRLRRMRRELTGLSLLHRIIRDSIVIDKTRVLLYNPG